MQLDQCVALQRSHNSHSLASGDNNGGSNNERYEATMKNISVHSQIVNCDNGNKQIGSLKCHFSSQNNDSDMCGFSSKSVASLKT